MWVNWSNSCFRSRVWWGWVGGWVREHSQNQLLVLSNPRGQNPPFDRAHPTPHVAYDVCREDAPPPNRPRSTPPAVKRLTGQPPPHVVYDVCGKDAHPQLSGEVAGLGGHGHVKGQDHGVLGGFGWAGAWAWMVYWSGFLCDLGHVKRQGDGVLGWVGGVGGLRYRAVLGGLWGLWCLGWFGFCLFERRFRDCSECGCGCLQTRRPAPLRPTPPCPSQTPTPPNLFDALLRHHVCPQHVLLVHRADVDAAHLF